MWLFAFFVLAFSLQHVPAEFNQPYIKLLQHGLFNAQNFSALISGCMVAISMLGGALGASISMRLLERMGVQKLLLAGLAIMMLIISGMATFLTPFVLLLVLLRNFPMAFSEAPLLAAVAPHIDSSFRATYLSMQSLAGRLGFALLLVSIARIIDTGAGQSDVSWPHLQLALLVSLVVGVAGIAILLIFRKSTGAHLAP